MNNEEAYHFFNSNYDESFSGMSRLFIQKYGLEEATWDYFRRKFSDMKKERQVYLKKSDLTTWNELYFCTPKIPLHSEFPQSSDYDFSIDILQTSEPTVEFKEDFSRKPVRHISNLQNRSIRNRLAELRSHVEAVAQHEDSTPKTIAIYLVKLYSLEEHDNCIANAMKEVINTGKFGKVNNKLSLDTSAYLLDSLEIGKSKYLDLRRVLLTESIILPGYNSVALHRNQISLVDDIHCVEREGYSVGIGIGYKKLLTHTVNRILSNISIHDSEQPLEVRISDGLDGSGSHRVYHQVTSHPDISSKNFLLFGFKVITISDNHSNTLWKNPVPNSPFSIRPIALLALPENLANVSFLMKTMINEETDVIEKNGLDLINGHHATIDILRTQLDGKMANILSGAAGASCQFCTATFKEIHDVDLVSDGFPINRFISDAKVLFQEVNEEKFLSLTSDQRFNLTHVPVSDIDIIPSSPLHAYLRCFSWLMDLIGHLNGGVYKWSPSSFKVKSARNFVCGLLKDKLNILIDVASSQGGTSTTGNVVRRCLVQRKSSEKDFIYWVLSTIQTDYKETIISIHTYLGAILRVYNCGRRIDTEELALVCRKLYLLILKTFPWANITPTLHKVLAHAPDIISSFNNGLGLEQLSEEGLEASNKLIRRYRERLSRKFSFEDNMKDVFTRLLCVSDPLLLLNRRVNKSVPQASLLVEDISDQEILVNSLILPEDD